MEQIVRIAKMKKNDIMARDLKAAVSEVLGTGVSMGVTVEGKDPRDVQKEINRFEEIEKEAILSWDGNNFLIRIPNEIIDYLGIKKEDRFKKSLLFKLKEEKDGTVKKTFDIIPRTKKRKIRKKNVRKKTFNKK